jgi:hypothetical protein
MAMASQQRRHDYSASPPPIEQPNIFPLSWTANTTKLEEIWDKSRRDYWDPAKLPWDTLDLARYTDEQREAIGYWWGLLSVFDASAPPVFAQALIRSYEVHEEDPVRRAFFSIERDEQNHEQVCGMMLQTFTPGFPDYEPRTETGRSAKRNLEWLYHNGARYWNGYKAAMQRYDLSVVFSFFPDG